jgi:hypothetical protein
MHHPYHTYARQTHALLTTPVKHTLDPSTALGTPFLLHVHFMALDSRPVYMSNIMVTLATRNLFISSEV